MVRNLLVGLLLVGATLTGCLGKQGEDAPPVDTVNDTGINAVPPDGRDGKLVAFEETNSTEEGVGGVDHDHDLWNGQSRVVIFEEKASMEPYPDDQNRAFAEFRPPGATADTPAALIFEGTGSVEFTLANPERRVCPYGGTLDGDYVCTDFGTGTRAPDPTGGPAGLKLRYKHASTTQWIDVGELVWGTPLPIKITDPRNTDMPHATSSLWEFQVVSPNPQDVTLTFTAKAELVRGDADVPLWPGHPNFYAERSSREVLNNPVAEACDGGTPDLGCATAEPDAVASLAAQKLISYGTKTLHVWVNISEPTFPNPATKPDHWFLYHINATGRSNITDTAAEDVTIDATNLYWVLPVDDNGMDSPYADGSRWLFKLGASLTTPVGVSCYENCADFYAKYSIVVHATNEELAPDAYHMNCLRPEECPAEE